MDMQKLWDAFSDLAQVEAIALGGSRAVGTSDDKSDYDVYVYVNGKIAKEERQAILEQYCDILEIGNHYWEDEDNCRLQDGICLDVIYRNLDEFLSGVDRVVIKGEAANGYTTCMWHNLITSDILYDRDGRLGRAKERYQVPYPRELKKNIIERNSRLLSGCLPSYDAQIAKAVKRRDYTSINHRVAAFLESYYDVIFACNEMPHPGEKRLQAICKEKCHILPDQFEENLEKLFQVMYTDGVCDVIAHMVEALNKVTDLK